MNPTFPLIIGLAALLTGHPHRYIAQPPAPPISARAKSTTPKVREMRLLWQGKAVRIVRDQFGVPHIIAPDTRSLFYGNGYAVAQDRLAQMEMFRRNARGELAELLGTGAVEADKETRLDGYTEEERLAQFRGLNPRVREMLMAYVDGINAYITERKQETKDPIVASVGLPIPLHVQSLRSWTVTDSIAIVQMMGRRFGGSESRKLRNLTLLQELRSHDPKTASALFDNLVRTNTVDSPTTLSADDEALQSEKRTTMRAKFDNVTTINGITPLLSQSVQPDTAETTAQILEQRARIELAQSHGLMTKLGSYCFVVNGKRSATGSPILVGGPQMGFFAPAISHEVHLSMPGMDCIGMGFAGVPGILIGFNRHLAWSFTVGHNDQSDVFLESLSPDNSYQYRYRDAWRTMERRTETISVAGGKDVTVEVLETIHGPVVQMDSPNHIAYSRNTTYRNREAQTLEAIAGIMLSKNVKDFGRSCSVIAVSLNAFCATTQGDIGFWYCGRTPIRAQGGDTRLPVSGDGHHDWQGILPFSAHPHVVNPRNGYLANWNNKPSPTWSNSDHFEWGHIFRSARIAEMLAAKASLDRSDLRGIVKDIAYNNIDAEKLLPRFLEAARRQPALLSDVAVRSIDYLQRWDYHDNSLPPASLIFDEWLREVKSDLFRPSLGFLPPALFDSATTSSLTLEALERAPRSQSSPAEQVDYLAGRDADALITSALNRAISQLVTANGMDISTWHKPERMINFGPLPAMPASNRGTYIQIVELYKSKIVGFNILPPGQNENRESSNAADQIDLAKEFRFKPMLLDINEILSPTRSDGMDCWPSDR